MNSEDVLVPATGSDGEMEVIEISVSVGDDIEHDQTIIVLESDKATVEVPSPKSGNVDSVKVSVGDKVKEGDILIQLSVSEKDLPNSNEGLDSESEKTRPMIKKTENAENTTAFISTNVAAMTVQTVVVPDLGGSEQVEVIEVVGSVGDLIEEDQTLIVLESDKATMEIPCPFSGSLTSLNIKVGDKVSAGDVIAEVAIKGQLPSSNYSSKDTKEGAAAPTNNVPSLEIDKGEDQTKTTMKAASTQDNAFSDVSVHAGPSVRKFAREHGVDLSKVKPSGPRERILVDDVSAYIKAQVQRVQSGAITSGYVGSNIAPLPDFKQFGDISVLSMAKVHVKTAENMQRSWSVPQVTQFDEADITELENFRHAQKTSAEAKGIKVTPIVFLLKACAYVLKTLPQFNVALDLAQQQLIQKHFIHIGFAVDTPHGLFVPVVRNVDKKGIWELAAECQELANKARDKKLKPADMQGGCFTISSLGAIGGTAFTPIVNAPEVAILGVSKAQMKPVHTGQNNFEARLMLPLSLTYDHRAVNGADGARFTSLLAKVMGDIRELLL